MKVKTIGRKVNLKQNFIDSVEKRMSKLDRFFDDDAEAKVTVTVEKDWQTAEITVKSKGFLFRAERTAPEMETAFADAADLIVKQIVKNKERLGTHVKRAEVDIVAAEKLYIDTVPSNEQFNIVREKRFLVEPMTVEEAVLQMNMLNHSFFIFKNAESGELNVVYRRHDDDYGLLIPEQ
ncbi:MAG: ribosome-associated translation inhibitor RaiA [Ruminococcaceae bacterium]|jgi:putative sigma-54 modulation protein|nr:ribosome-associated translation inhibitor RaiA [Oscillospiraceae bacterium]